MRSETRAVNVVTTTLAGGGAEKQLLLSVKGLSLRGVQCQVFVLRALQSSNPRYSELLRACESAGAIFHVPRRSSAAASVGVIVALLRRVWFGPPAHLWLWGFRAQLLHALMPLLWVQPTAVALRSANPRPTRAELVITWLGRWRVDRYISNSRRALDQLNASVPGIGRRGLVVFNAVEPALLEAEQRRGTVVAPTPMDVAMLGNVRFQIKGYDTALDVAELIRARQLPVRIRIAGAQYEGERDLAHEIQVRGLDSIVTFCGPVTSPKEFLQKADAYLLLSRFEGLPNALMEAMSLGLPCISTDVGDVAQWRTSDCLRVVRIGDSKAVAGQLEEWLADWTDAVEIGQRARDFARAHFRADEMVSAVERAFGWQQSIYDSHVIPAGIE